MKNSVCMVALISLLAGCSVGTSERIVMTVTDIYADTSPMGCFGTIWNTVLSSTDGRVDKICGKWGAVGTEISGCWVRGASDPDMNGFQREC